MRIRRLSLKRKSHERPLDEKSGFDLIRRSLRNLPENPYTSDWGNHMKRNIVLTSTSLLAILLLSLHLTGDIVYGSDKSVAANVVVVVVLLIWLYGTLVLAGRRSGYAIMLLGSIAGMVVFTVHVSRPGGLSAGTLAQSSGAFFFVWNLLALAVSSAFSAILCLHGLWNLRRSKVLNAAINS